MDVKQHSTNSTRRLRITSHQLSWTDVDKTQELCESRGGRPGLPSLINLRFLWTQSNTQPTQHAVHHFTTTELILHFSQLDPVKFTVHTAENQAPCVNRQPWPAQSERIKVAADGRGCGVVEYWVKQAAVPQVSIPRKRPAGDSGRTAARLDGRAVIHTDGPYFSARGKPTSC